MHAFPKSYNTAKLTQAINSWTIHVSLTSYIFVNRVYIANIFYPNPLPNSNSRLPITMKGHVYLIGELNLCVLGKCMHYFPAINDLCVE
jgi:hypothetical protein